MFQVVTNCNSSHVKQCVVTGIELCACFVVRVCRLQVNMETEACCVLASLRAARSGRFIIFCGVVRTFPQMNSTMAL